MKTKLIWLTLIVLIMSTNVLASQIQDEHYNVIAIIKEEKSWWNYFTWTSDKYTIYYVTGGVQDVFEIDTGSYVPNTIKVLISTDGNYHIEKTKYESSCIQNIWELCSGKRYDYGWNIYLLKEDIK